MNFNRSVLTGFATKVVAALCFASLQVSQAHAVAISGQGTWETTLLGRDLDGDTDTFEAYFDTALNITWLTDANYAKTSNYDADGRMKWLDAQTWVSQLNINGVTGWRLAMGSTVCSGGLSCVNNQSDELAHLFYVTLANKSYYSESGAAQSNYGFKNSGPFVNVNSSSYWTGKSSDDTFAMYLSTEAGQQSYYNKAAEYYFWAVRSGDVAAAMVPEPSTYSLLVLGVVALFMLSQRQRQNS